MKTITLTDDDYKKVEEVLKAAKTVEDKPSKKTIIYKTDGSVLYESDKETVKEAIVEADLYGADLHEANLRGANLRGANLHGASLHEANLRGANLRGADLYGADLYGADLYGADLYGAELCNARFYGKGGTIQLKESQVADFLDALGFQIED